MIKRKASLLALPQPSRHRFVHSMRCRDTRPSEIDSLFRRGKALKHVNEERDHKDPACGMRVNRLTAVAEAEYERKLYYFCAEECRDAFLADPAKYLPRHRQHGVPPKSRQAR